jgi:hypothetical protein
VDGEKGTGKMGVGSDSLAQSRGEWKDFLGAMRSIDPLAMGHDQILWPVRRAMIKREDTHHVVTKCAQSFPHPTDSPLPIGTRKDP